MKLLPCLGLLAWVLCGCASSAPATEVGSGVQGTVTIGPTCPVERINSPCPPRPVGATVIVQDASGKEIARFESAADGRFKTPLKPGRYTLVGLSQGSGGLPRPIPTGVVVVAGAYASVEVQFDSGIR